MSQYCRALQHLSSGVDSLSLRICCKPVTSSACSSVAEPQDPLMILGSSAVGLLPDLHLERSLTPLLLLVLFLGSPCRTEALDKLFKRSSSGALRLKSKKPVVLVLGTGWGAHSLAKVNDAQY